MKWEHHLRDVHFTLQTDHKNLTCLNTEIKQKVQRWKFIVQEYDFDVEHIAGKDNIVADGLSRFCEFQLIRYFHHFQWIHLKSIPMKSKNKIK